MMPILENDADTAGVTKEGIKMNLVQLKPHRLITESKADIAEATQLYNQKRS